MPSTFAMVAVPLSEATVIFERRLERTHQQALRARALVEEMPELAAAAGARIDTDLGDSAWDALPMAALAQRLALRSEQVEFLWAVVACSVDGRLIPHLEALGGAHARRGLSPAVYAMLSELDDESVARLAHWLASPNPLIAGRLLSITEPASPAARAYVAAPRLVDYLLGAESPAIAPLHVVGTPAHLVHDARQRATLGDLTTALSSGRDAVVVIEGPAGSGRATAAACATGLELVALDLARLAPSEVGDELVALRRECLLRGALPVLANVDQALGEEARDLRRIVGAFLDGTAGPAIVTVAMPGTDLGTARPLVRLAWSVCDTDSRIELWRHAAGEITGDLPTLAHRYRVGPAAIERAVSSVRLVRPPGAAISATDLGVGLRHNIAERLGGLARRVEVNQSWDDLVIADDIADLIAGLIGRIRHAHQVLNQWGFRRKIARGTGVAALFSGPPGTGKTMVAGLVARELDLELYQVDLSKVVSKWIGETEQNLARVFDAAEEGHALLLFDEADSLFAKRSSDVKSATDRYANLEVNYLLQRVESFGGITVLTTNLDTAIDSALKRRLAAHVVFASPDEPERADLWRRQTTTGSAPLAGDVDPDELAREFPLMTGANIRNAAISAAFLAAGDRAHSITRDHLLRAARAEYRSMGHMVTERATRRGL